jgi:hypothetical protein
MPAAIENAIATSVSSIVAGSRVPRSWAIGRVV